MEGVLLKEGDNLVTYVAKTPYSVLPYRTITSLGLDNPYPKELFDPVKGLHTLPALSNLEPQSYLFTKEHSWLLLNAASQWR